MKNKYSKFWFTIVELMVGILIFTIWWLSAYLLVYSSLNSSRHSKNEIIAVNLARESIELIRNNRDNNWLQVLSWDKLDNAGDAGNYLTWWYYIVDNDFSNTNSQIKIIKLSSSFIEDNKYIINPKNIQVKTQLCIDSLNRFSHNCGDWNKETKFYSYIRVEKLKTKTNKWTIIDVDNAYKIIANVVNSEKWFSNYYISTIITDWKNN